jgi:hypothetical protein
MEKTDSTYVKTDQNDFEPSLKEAADFIERVRLNQQKLTAEPGL